MPMEHAQTHDGVKQVTVIPILPNVIILSYDSTDINEQQIICTDFIPVKIQLTVKISKTTSV